MALVKNDLINAVKERCYVTEPLARNLVESFFEVIKSSLEEGDSVKLMGFGNFIIRKKEARIARNPKTGEEALVEARQVVAFKPGKNLKTKPVKEEDPKKESNS
ncbi:MAG: integration host factor subunit alpha [Proteobacteria bacterium]|nr:integration host factor subunit alpha [Pseudomonadota bacterium]